MPIADVLALDSIQVRGSVSAEHVETLTAAVASGVILPPLRIAECNGDGWLIDGHHRLKAWKEAKRREVPAVIIPCTGYGDALRLAIAANAEHGLRLNKRDLERAFRMTKEAFPDLPIYGEVGSIQAILKVPKSTLANVKAKVETGQTSWQRRQQPLVRTGPGAGSMLKAIRELCGLSLQEVGSAWVCSPQFVERCEDDKALPDPHQIKCLIKELSNCVSQRIADWQLSRKTGA